MPDNELQAALDAAARAYCQHRYRYDPATYGTGEFRDRHVENDARATAIQSWLPVVIVAARPHLPPTDEQRREISAQALREAAAEARACLDCGKAHRPIDRGGYWAPSWGSPDDGHAYRLANFVHSEEWANRLDARADALGVSVPVPDVFAPFRELRDRWYRMPGYTNAADALDELLDEVAEGIVSDAQPDRDDEEDFVTPIIGYPTKADVESALRIADAPYREDVDGDLLDEDDVQPDQARAGYEQAISTLRDVAQRTGSPAARWAADYLAADPDRRAPDRRVLNAPERPSEPSDVQPAQSCPRCLNAHPPGVECVDESEPWERPDVQPERGEAGAQ